jgi:hypothetical protein
MFSCSKPATGFSSYGPRRKGTAKTAFSSVLRWDPSTSCRTLTRSSSFGSGLLVSRIFSALRVNYNSTAAFRRILMIPIAVVLEMYQWLMCYLLEKTEFVLQSLLKDGKDSFTARNESQVFHARTLSLAYIEHFCMMLFWKRANEKEDNEDLLPILTKIVTLFGLWCIEKHLGTLYEGIFSPTSPLIKSKIFACFIRWLCQWSCCSAVNS